MKFPALRMALFALVTDAPAWWDEFLDAWNDIAHALIEQRWSQGWRPEDPFDRENVTAWMREGNRGVDAPLVEHAGSLDG